MRGTGTPGSSSRSVSRTDRFAERDEAKPFERNAHATRQRIIEAAFIEFAAAGLAGARVDRIAATARCNKSLIFVYFENKAALFTTVARKELERLKNDVVFTPSDFPQFAARMFDFAMEHPNSMRLLAWYGIEEIDSGGGLAASSFNEGSTWKSGPPSGGAGTPLPTNFLLTAIIALSTAWSQANPFRQMLDSNERDLPSSLRKLVVEGVTRLVE